MPVTNACDPGATILVAEDDVLVRIAIAEYLRGCGFRVIEAAGGLEARTVLQHGPDIDVMLADARLAGDDNGFALAQWVRRYRPQVSVVLSVTLENKSEAAAHLCARNQTPPPAASHLRDRINAMRQRSLRTTRPAAGRVRARMAARRRVS
jgi:CheY-like chemotaxis protein